MMDLRNDSDEWPEGGIDRDWLHSDFREVGFLHTHPLYEKFVEIGNLQ